MYNDDDEIEIDAQNNWWNDADGPTGAGPGDDGDRVSPHVAYDPFSTYKF